MSLISKNELCRLLPHAGTMCLLDSVLHWDNTSIICTAGSHRNHDNPLRRFQRLPTVCGLEYAAQAIGAHIGLTATTRTGLALGFLGSIKDLELYSPYLDECSDDLEIQSKSIFGQDTAFIYTFSIQAGAKVLLEGRSSIFVKYLANQ